MKSKVGIAELKAHLSEYVRAAQKGKEIIIKDRDAPIAKMVPIRDRKWPPRIIPASRPVKGIDEMPGVTVPGLKPEDVERAFAETRADRLDEWSNSVEYILTHR